MQTKRLFDLGFTVPGLLVLAPLLAAIALWIKLDSPGPVFFRQTRVGLKGKLFRIYKFRTMVADAERLGRPLTVGGDARITNSGAFLRKYKLDELAQLFNVLAGDMSLVGPRPEVPKYIALYPDAVRQAVLSVRPGITDFAAIEYKDENALLAGAADPERVYVERILPAKQAYYLKYVAEQNLLLDLRLILATLKAVFVR